MRENVAQLYENQASFLINEATGEGSNGAFETVVFPIVRRVFSKLLANEIVSVQAMNLPIGKLFFFVPKIQGYSGGTANQSGDHYAPIGSPGNYGNAALAGQGYGDSAGAYQKNLYDLFYEGTEPGLNPGGLFDYSKGRWSAITSNATTVAWSNGALSPTQTGYTGNVRKVIISLCGFNDLGYGKLMGPDGSFFFPPLIPNLSDSSKILFTSLVLIWPVGSGGRLIIMILLLAVPQ
jgi:hypothetical protein